MPPLPVSESLKRQPFTRGLSGEHLAKLMAFTTEVSFLEDEVIFAAGRPSSHLYLVMTGCVCVEVRTPVFAVCIQVVGPGEAFGWTSLLAEHETQFQVRALSRTTALSVASQQLLEACEEDPRFGLEVYRRVLEMVAGRISAIEARLAEFCGVAGTPRSRVAGRGVLREFREAPGQD